MSKSSTFENTSEPVAYAYGTGSVWTKGWRVKDTVGLGGVATEAAEFSVIDQERNTRLSETSAGLSGWSWPSTDNEGRPSIPVPYAQATNGQWSEATFGLYLNRRNPRAEAAGTASAGDGALTISGIDESYIDGEIAWVNREPLNEMFDFAWMVPFPSASSNGQAVPLEGETHAILDSGTTLVFGPPNAVREFWSHVDGARDLGDGSWAIDCDRKDIKASFNLAGKDWEFDPTDLIFEDVPGKCYGTIVYDQGMSHLGEHWLVGGAFLKNVYSAWSYDPPRVGLAKLRDGL